MTPRSGANRRSQRRKKPESSFQKTTALYSLGLAIKLGKRGAVLKVPEPGLAHVNISDFAVHMAQVIASVIAD